MESRISWNEVSKAATVGAGDVTNSYIDAESISMNAKQSKIIPLCNKSHVRTNNAILPDQRRPGDPKFDTLLPPRTEASDETKELPLLERCIRGCGFLYPSDVISKVRSLHAQSGKASHQGRVEFGAPSCKNVGSAKLELDEPVTVVNGRHRRTKGSMGETAVGL